MSGPFWETFEREAEEAYAWLMEHVDGLWVREGDRDRLPHFAIRPGMGGVMAYLEEVERDRDEIQRELIRRIEEERREGRLLRRENWLPQRNLEHHSYSYLVYRGRWAWGAWVIQLGVELFEWDYENCPDCLPCDEEDNTHVIAVVWGRRGEVEEGIPDREWKRR